jgi:hypothetical protein
VSDPILHLTILQSPVFLVNSRLRLFTAALSCYTRKEFHINRASLFPKLRDHFAEFLNESYLERLRILTPPTCVGLRYGHLVSRLEVFLGSIKSEPSRFRRFAPPLPGIMYPDLPKYLPHIGTGKTNSLRPYLPTSLHHDNLHQVVQEYKPAAHRLRLSASP